MELQQTIKLKAAADFINSTDSHLFLTGKAGTGKTTFLRQLAAETYKSFLIVAPTGIAALNAGGVTIHSQFLLPFGSFIPEREPVADFSETGRFYTKHTLIRTHTLNSMRKKVLRATDLLIIDEVSMLRADILDAIDFRMRYAKGNFARSFGGAQVLMTGDLHQLPPIVKDEEWELLKKYYRSMHFFEALAFRKENLVYIELDRIFRQRDDQFIGILNRLRDNRATKEDIATLNQRYRGAERTVTSDHTRTADRTETAAQSGTADPSITITTHNYIADDINSRKMEELPSDSFFFGADIYGDFPEKLYPLPPEIELKAGARIMFIKNDSGEEKSYVNGQLATVDSIDEDEIVVIMSESGMEYTLKRETWENKTYVINEETKDLEEEVSGSFVQYPVKPAWAVTVHKSQGLTFEKAIIDVGKAFAPGQVYVALSRLRSLDGLTLRTRIIPTSIMSDGEVHDFTGKMEQQKPLPDLLTEKQHLYLGEILESAFNFSVLIRQIENLQKFRAEKMQFEDEVMEKALAVILQRIRDEEKNTRVFRAQLHQLLKQKDRESLLERIARGGTYYTAFMKENLKQLLIHLAEVMRLVRTKTYRNQLSEIDQQMVICMGRLEKAGYLADSILSGRNIEISEKQHRTYLETRRSLWEMAEKAAEENPKFTSTKSGRKRKKASGQAKGASLKKGAKQAKGAKQNKGSKQKIGLEPIREPKPEKGETYRVTWSLVHEGKTIQEIADRRDLAVSTVEGHVISGLREGMVDIRDVLKKDTIEAIAQLIKDSSDSIGKIHDKQNGKYTYGELRMVQAFLR